MAGGGGWREALGGQVAHGGEGGVLVVDDRGGEPLEEGWVGAARQAQGLVQVPAADVEDLVEPPLQDVPRGLQAQVVLDGADVDEADVEVGVGRLEAPGPTTRLHGEQNPHAFGRFEATKLV